MEESFEQVVKEEWYRQDFKDLSSQIKEHENLLRLKRRLLMDLPLSETEQKRIENDRSLPESLLREDDVWYENIRTSIEVGFGVRKVERHVVQEDIQNFDSYNDLKDCLAVLENMTNKGLSSFVEILTGGTIEFEKTKCRMEKAIKRFLPLVLSQTDEISQTKLKQLCELLRDPQNFFTNQMVSATTSVSCCSAAIKLLNGLEDFPLRTLSAMHRKLRGIRGYVPSLQGSKSGWGRVRLVNAVRKSCMKMLRELGKDKKLPEPLVGALVVATLTSKLMLKTPMTAEFRKFSPEIEVLQNDIAKAIWLLDERKKVSLIELKKLQLLLDPDAELSDRSLRMGIRGLLTEYLFECGDMENVPDFLVKTISIINKRSQRPSKRKHLSSQKTSSPTEIIREEIEKELEGVLTVSAQAKQLVWDLFSEHGFDQEFADAYMEDFAELGTPSTSDDEYEQTEIPSKHDRFHSYDDPFKQTESIGETTAISTSPVSMSERNGCSSYLPINEDLESVHVAEVEVESTGSIHAPSCRETEYSDEMHTPYRNQQLSGVTGEVRIPCSDSLSSLVKEAVSLHCDSRYGTSTSNQYLMVQEACDEMSMVAYSFIGHMLDEFSKSEGLELYQGDRSYLLSHTTSDPEHSKALRNRKISHKDRCSTMVHVLEELLPSFPECGKEKLMKLVGTK